MWIYECITELLTAFLGKNMTYERKTTDFKIIDIAHYKTCKKRSLAADYMISIRYYPQTATPPPIYESTDEPAGRPIDNPPNVDG